MKNKNIVRLAAAFLAAFFTCVGCSCSSTKNTKQQMLEVRKAKPVTSYNESRDLEELMDFLKNGGLTGFFAEVKAKAEVALPKSPTGYAGQYKIFAHGVGKTEVGREFAIPEYVYLDKPTPPIGVLDPEADAYEMRARFVDTIGVITLRRVDGGKGNKVFCFSEKVNELEKAEISENSIFVIEDTTELTFGGERVVRVRAVGLEGRVYEGKHRAPPLERVRKKKSVGPKETGPSTQDSEFKKLMKKPAENRAA